MKLRRWWRHVLCGLSGHDLLFSWEPGERIYLKCAKCGWESIGWDVL